MQLSKYEILEELGHGGFGIVYKAKDLTLSREVALKVLHPQLAADLNFVSRFQGEAHKLASLEHTNIVPIHEFGESEGRYFICMRYLSGGSLHTRIYQSGGLEFKQAMEILENIVNGLSYAHSKGIIHRDVKPQNILFDQMGTAVVSDFGLAYSSMTSSSSISLGGVGTPHYRAPEIWHGEKALEASDQYSLACVFVEMLTGRILFDGRTTPMVMMRHFEPLILPPDIHDSLAPILKKALDKNPENRFKNISEFLNVLKAYKTSQFPGIHDPDNEKTVNSAKTSFGKYKIINEMEHGKTGAFYKAQDSTTGALCTLKILNPSLSSSPEFVTRFRQEAQIKLGINHPNIVKIIDFGEVNGYLFYATQYASGGSLRDLIRKTGKLSEEQIKQVLHQVISGLKHIHEMRIVHRNLNPANILFNEEGEALISDFGLAIYEDPGPGSSVAAEIDADPGYVAPEIWQGAPATIAADIYSLGCILFEMLCGKPLFNGNSTPEVMKKHLTPQYSWNQLNENIPEYFKPALAKALDANPAARYDSLDLMLFQKREKTSANSKPGSKVRKGWVVSLISIAVLAMTFFLVNHFMGEQVGERSYDSETKNLENPSGILANQIGEGEEESNTRTRITFSPTLTKSVAVIVPTLEFKSTNTLVIPTKVSTTKTTAPTGNINYIGCPISNLKIGDSAFVSDNRSHDIRISPDTTLNNNIITSASSGDILLIIDGPSCDVNGFIFWKVQTTFKKEGWIEEWDGTSFAISLLTTRQLCPGALPSRLAVGMKAKVMEEPPLANAVATKPHTEALWNTKIPPGGEMIILDGPNCSQDYNWWYVRSLSDGKEGWTREGNSTEYFIAPIINK